MTEEKTQKKKKIKSKYSLPSPNLKIETQLEVLKGYCIASDYGQKGVRYTDVSKFVSVAKPNISGCNKFFESIRFLKKDDNRGKYIPSDEAIDWCKKQEWDKENAKNSLKPLIEKSWFGEFSKKLISIGPKSKDELIAKLGEEAEASKDDESSLNHIVDYLMDFNIITEKEEKIFLTNKIKTEKTNPKKDTGTIHSPVTQVEMDKTTKEYQLNFTIGINISPDMAEKDIRKCVRIVLDEINKVNNDK